MVGPPAVLRRLLPAALALLLGPALPLPGEDPAPALQWKRLGGWPAALAAADSLVFVGSAERGLAALRAADGRPVWQTPRPGPGEGGLAADGDLVVAVESGQILQARRAATGEGVWTCPVPGAERVWLSGDRVMAATGEGWLHLFDRGDGAPVGRLRTGFRQSGWPAFGGRLWYAGTADGQLVAVDAVTGLRAAAVEVGERIRAVAVAGDRLLTGENDGYVRAYELPGLARRWQQRLGAPLVAEPLLAGGAAVCAAANGWVYGLDPGDGRIRWKVAVESTPTGMAQVAEGLVVVAGEAGHLVALDPGPGAVAWRTVLQPGRRARLAATPASLLAACEDGYLYSFYCLGRCLGAAPPAGAETDRLWWALYDRGHRTGYGWRRAEPGGRAWQEGAVGWRSGYARSEATVTADGEFRPLTWAYERREGGQVLRRRVCLSGDTLRWEDALGDQVDSGSLRLPPGALLGEGIPARLGGTAGPGRFPVFDLETLTLRPVAAVLETVPTTDTAPVPGPAAAGIAPETRAAGARPAPPAAAAVLRLRPGPPWPLQVLSGQLPTSGVEAADLFAELELLEWLDAEGTPVNGSVPDLGLEQVRTSGPAARSWEAPRPAAPLRLDRAVAQPGRLDCLVVSLPGSLGDARRLFPGSDRQAVVADPAGWAVVVRRAAVPAAGQRPGGAVADSALAPYRRPDLYAPSGHPRLRALAARLLAGADPGPEAAARRLQAWVYDHLRPADTEVRFRSALEVLDDLEGTCSEYAVLLVALCRAAEVPARTAVGFAVSPSGELVLHMWVQLHLGAGWVDVDPSANAFPAGADLVETGHGRLSPATISRMNLVLQYILARADTLKVTAYRRGDLRFSGRAEELWEEAGRAEGDSGEERVHELLQGIVRLPWNQRSGAAHLRIAEHWQRRGRPEAARQAYERLLRLAPGNPQAAGALFYLARLAEEAGDRPGAEALLDSLTAAHPDADLADDALARLAELRLRAGGCGAAQPYYERLREAYPTSGWAQVAGSALARCAGEDGPAEP